MTHGRRSSTSWPSTSAQVRGIVHPSITKHFIMKAGSSGAIAQTGAVTLIQRVAVDGSLDIHFHPLFLHGVYAQRPDRSLRIRWVKASTIADLARLVQTLALRIGRLLEWQGLPERDAQGSYLTRDGLRGRGRWTSRPAVSEMRVLPTQNGNVRAP